MGMSDKKWRVEVAQSRGKNNVANPPHQITLTQTKLKAGDRTKYDSTNFKIVPSIRLKAVFPINFLEGEQSSKRPKNIFLKFTLMLAPSPLKADKNEIHVTKSRPRR